MKVCGKCRIEKPKGSFNRETKAKDGLSKWCKPCKAEYAREYEKKNRASQAEKATIWAKKNPEKIKEYARRNYLRNGHKLVEYHREYGKAFEKRPEQIAKRKEYRLKNKEAMSRRSRESYLRNREQVLERHRKWDALNEGARSAICARRRAKLLRATPAWANAFFIDEIYDLMRRRAKLTGLEWHVDHIIPLQGKNVCGLHVENNLQVILGHDNRRKSNRYVAV